MSYAIYPEPSISVDAQPKVKRVTAASNAAYYKAPVALGAGVYTVSCTSSTIATVDFLNGSGGVITTAVTSSGTVNINLSSACSSITYMINTGSNIDISITLVAEVPVFSAMSGTLDTITTTSTYNQTGRLHVIAVGGGGGGASATGGGSGGVAFGVFTTNSSTAVTIGALGAIGAAGGATSFGNLLSANGGGAGGYGQNAPVGSAGSPGGATGGGFGNGDGGGGGTSTAIGQYVKAGTTGGGGGSGYNGNTQSQGGGSGIGTGGVGGSLVMNNNAGAGSGYGAGGGASFARGGAQGAQGVVYVLRGLS